MKTAGRKTAGTEKGAGSSSPPVRKEKHLMTGNDILYLVIPCYNEEAVLHETAKQLLEKMNSMFERGMISRESKIMFVNDGSKDKTWEIIEELHASNPIYSGVKLSRNKGHQNALLAGLMTAKEKADMTQYHSHVMIARQMSHKDVKDASIGDLLIDGAENGELEDCIRAFYLLKQREPERLEEFVASAGKKFGGLKELLVD